MSIENEIVALIRKHGRRRTNLVCAQCFGPYYDDVSQIGLNCEHTRSGPQVCTIEYAPQMLLERVRKLEGGKDA